MATHEAAGNQIVDKYVRWAAGAGLIPIPLVDIASVTGIQLKMLSDLSGLYGVPFAKNRGKSILGSLLGSIVPTNMAYGTVGSLLKAVPVIGTALGVLTMPAFAGAATYAVGKVFVQHFEAGGTFLDFDPSKVRTYFEQQYHEGKDALSSAVADRKKPVPGTASA